MTANPDAKAQVKVMCFHEMLSVDHSEIVNSKELHSVLYKQTKDHFQASNILKYIYEFLL